MSKNRLCDQELHAGGHLLGEVFQVLLGADCVDVRLGEAGAADRKRVVGGDQFHQFARVLQAALRLAPLLLARGRVAAQREHVVDARALHLVERGAQFRHGGAHAGEVRHRLQPVLLADALDDLDRFAPGGAAGAVGDRHERRVQAAQLAERRAQVLLPRLRLGREELERERSAPPEARIWSMRIGPNAIRRRSTARARPGYARPGRSTSRCRSIASVSVSSHWAVIGERFAPCTRGRISNAVSGSPARPATASACLDRCSPTSVRLPSMWACTSVNVRPWPGRHRRASQRLDDVERAHEFADRVGRVAVVEEREDAPQQVIAGDQQAVLGLEQADVRGRMTGRLVDGPGAEVGLDDDALPRSARSGSIDRGDARFVVAGALGGVAAQRLLGHAATGARSPGVARSPRRDPRPRRTCARSWGASTAHSRRAPRSWRPARSGRSGHACRPPGARPRSARPHIASARSRCASDPGCVDARVEQHDPVAGRDRPGVAVGHAGPRQRQAQAKDAGQHAFAPPQLALADCLGHERGD